ncbi:hypothetical protein MMC12_006756 [Toensbergia leucococca]|nr:hypothetical protein [Toensbergia leucococca]
MSLELHIWGPAFFLPSIDPQCLAALSYLTQGVPRNQWTLLASCDDTLSPTRELPALRDGLKWIGGFRNIVDYLYEKSDGRWALDSTSPQDKADIAAQQALEDVANRTANVRSSFSSFIEAQGKPLLDLSLYVSNENYSAITRPAYSNLLQWPLQWILPPRRRAEAKANSDYLGLSSLDIDTASEEQQSKTPTVPSVDQIPPSLLKPRQTVLSLVKQNHQASRFRLDALSDAFLEPLQQLLGQKRFLLSNDEPSSLDCLAFAYLSLALFPELPHPWLAESMKSRFPSLCVYVENLIKELFGGPIGIEQAFPNLPENPRDINLESTTEDKRGNQTLLPWKQPEQSLLGSAGNILDTLLNSIPIYGIFRNKALFIQSPSSPSSTS